ncbi:aldolase [Nocardia yunnanensis]|uniref:Aldolase n=1 Tax=Nocardia yunnanensis TaxID=2382165 RepID=A0A386ZPZ6_9NOCA|nr:bifunctional 4-hydroxy-2-oxoglutarate aldolase/2-dehydro-3-deoxy-phosphogluconate aldolase [Nocardia yunnanensis]AYF79443.1 aldolase [Nocardia yunnanensis]
MNFLEDLRRERLVVIVRGKDADASLRTVTTLVAEGLPLVEVSLSGVGALDVIRAARRELGPDAWLGAGTVLTAEDAQRAVEAGANFVVTPGLGAGVAESVRLGLPVLAGAFTPTEVTAAAALGVTAVKLFPASLGGPDYFRALRGPFPDLPMVPVGGVTAEAATQYLRLGATAVGVGSPVLGDAADGGDLNGLRARAARFQEALG